MLRTIFSTDTNCVYLSPAGMCGEGNSTKNIGTNKRNICNVFLEISHTYQHTVRE